MARKGEARLIIHLGCNECHRETYTSMKNKKNDPQRLQLNKFCPRCRVHTLHREVK